MPRPPQSSAPELSPGEASYILDRLVSERRLSQGEINRYRSEMSREIDELEQRLQRLREAQGGGGGGAARTSGGGGASAAAAPAAPARRRRRRGGRPGRPPGRPSGQSGAGAGAGAGGAGQAQTSLAKARGGKRAGRKRSSITPEQLASRQLQGRYLALVRRFPANKRAQYAKTAKERGREAAIRDMQDALR